MIIDAVIYGDTPKPKIGKITRATSLSEAKIENRSVYYEQQGWVETPVFNRELLPVNEIVSGPAIVEEKAAVTVIYENQQLYLDDYGNIIIEMEEK